MEDITKDEWQELIEDDENAIILDVRAPHEWQEGIIENAIMINIQEPQSFMASIEELDKEKIYYVY